MVGDWKDILPAFRDALKEKVAAGVRLAGRGQAMDITRPAYWNIAGHELMFACLRGHGGGVRLGLLYGRTGAGRVPLARSWPADPWSRLRLVAAETIAQRRLLRERWAGLAHLALSWGFVLLFIGTLVVGAGRRLRPAGHARLLLLVVPVAHP